VQLLYGKSLPEEARIAGPVPVYGSNGVVGCHAEPAVQGPGIIVGRKGSVGEVAFSEGPFWPIDTTYYVHNVSRNNWRFLFYLLSGLGLDRLNSHSAVPGLNRESAYSLECSVPPKPEQEKIAAVLWKIQRAIEVEAKLVATTRELKQSAMRQLFTHGLRGERTKDTEIGLVPELWHVSNVGSLLDIRHGYAFKGQFFASAGNYVLLTPGHFYEHGGFRDQGPKTKYYTGEFPAEHLLNENDLLVAMTEQTSGLLGSAIFVPESGKFLHNQRLGLVINLDETRLSKAFFYYYLQQPTVRSIIEQTATGSKVRHTSPGRVRDLPIALPTIAEQREIAHILQTIDRKISLHERKRDTLRALFQTMLHKLMTAEIRVADLDIDTSEVHMPVDIPESKTHLRV
jgi:type I restriction enzyme S subunit